MPQTSAAAHARTHAGPWEVAVRSIEMCPRQTAGEVIKYRARSRRPLRSLGRSPAGSRGKVDWTKVVTRHCRTCPLPAPTSNDRGCATLNTAATAPGRPAVRLALARRRRFEMQMVAACLGHCFGHGRGLGDGWGAGRECRQQSGLASTSLQQAACKLLPPRHLPARSASALWICSRRQDLDGLDGWQRGRATSTRALVTHCGYRCIPRFQGLR